MRIIIEENARNGDKKLGEVVEYISSEFPEVDLETHFIMKFEGVK